MTGGQETFPRFDLFLIVTLSLIITVLAGPATTRAAQSENTQRICQFEICSNFKLQNMFKTLQNFPFISTVLIAHHFHRQFQT